jgi:hypothetical protein
MTTGHLFGVDKAQAFRFFFERLKDVSEPDAPAQGELLYNASVLAHFALTSTASTADFPAGPSGLTAFFDVFVLDRSRHHDSGILEAAGSQCLLLTGFFQDQLTRRHNVRWFATLGADFFDRAAQHAADRPRAQLLAAMAVHFEFWRRQQHRLARELRDTPRLIAMPPTDGVH